MNIQPNTICPSCDRDLFMTFQLTALGNRYCPYCGNKIYITLHYEHIPGEIKHLHISQGWLGEE